ncbi:MAG: REP-associated tyrosine transposase [Chthoniobacterales bacterium]
MVAAIDPDRHLVVSHKFESTFTRKALNHSGHFQARFGAIYFITICCQQRSTNQLCRGRVAKHIFETAAMYDCQESWHLLVLLLMPDHLHTLISVGGHKPVSGVIQNFKRATTKFAGIHWQRNYFDHRLRADESLVGKAEYIRQNPVRAGLTSSADDWPYVLDRDGLEKMAAR